MNESSGILLRWFLWRDISLKLAQSAQKKRLQKI